jgi:hypothetical protein
VSVYDYITPSEQAAELALLVNRQRKRAGIEELGALIVEGSTDKSLLEPHRTGPSGVIFPAGSRQLVEELLRHLRDRPIKGCSCVFLIDCDGTGKTPGLSGETSLLVTQACDVEADLIRLGVAERLARRFLPSDQAAADAVAATSRLALPISTVRRAAALASISMKRCGRQLRLRDFESEAITAVEAGPMSAADALDAVASELGWGDDEKEAVAARLVEIPARFDQVCMGKDALDLLHRRLSREGNGDVRGWSCDYFYEEVRRGLQLSDFSDWEVGRRLFRWQSESGQTLVAEPV